MDDALLLDTRNAEEEEQVSGQEDDTTKCDMTVSALEEEEWTRWSRERDPHGAEI